MTHSIVQTELGRKLGISVPIFSFAHSIDVTVEVTNAGGFGVFGGTRNTPDEIKSALKEIRAQVGDKPFGIDLVLPQGMPERDDREAIEAKLPEEHRRFVEGLIDKYQVPQGSGPGLRSRFVRSEEMARSQLEAVMASDVDLVACGIGVPPDVIERAKSLGKKTAALVGHPKHARKAMDAGVEILVAQGYDAGAHTGPVGTFSLVPQIVDVAGDIPVLAAGGVATGRQIAASYALGAQGVWLGTVWLGTREYELSDLIRRRLFDASSFDVVLSKADSGKPLRMLRSAWSDEWAARDAPEPLDMPYQDILVGDLLGAIEEHEVEALAHYPAGQSIAYVDHLRTVAQVMKELEAQASQCLTGLTNGT